MLFVKNTLFDYYNSTKNIYVYCDDLILVYETAPRDYNRVNDKLVSEDLTQRINRNDDPMTEID